VHAPTARIVTDTILGRHAAMVRRVQASSTKQLERQPRRWRAVAWSAGSAYSALLAGRVVLVAD